MPAKRTPRPRNTRTWASLQASGLRHRKKIGRMDAQSLIATLGLKKTGLNRWTGNVGTVALQDGVWYFTKRKK